METRREERIGQLLQELKRSDKLHLHNQSFFVFAYFDVHNKPL